MTVDLMSVHGESAWLGLQHHIGPVYPMAWVLPVPYPHSAPVLQCWGSLAHLGGLVTETLQRVALGCPPPSCPSLGGHLRPSLEHYQIQQPETHRPGPVA